MEAPAPLLEERDHRVERVERAHAEAGVVAAQRMRPARVALFAPRRQRHDVGAPARAAAAAERYVDWEADFVELRNHDGSLRARIELNERGRVDRLTGRRRRNG